jgi:hypothetical protein
MCHGSDRCNARWHRSLSRLDRRVPAPSAITLACTAANSATCFTKSEPALSRVLPFQKSRQLGDVGRNAPGDVFLNIGTLGPRRPFASAALQRSND